MAPDDPEKILLRSRIIELEEQLRRADETIRTLMRRQQPKRVLDKSAQSAFGRPAFHR